jgi:hypothetical protein
MSTNYKQRSVDLLNALETGDPKPFAYINPTKYIRHNLSVADGCAGVAALQKICPKERKSTPSASGFSSKWRVAASTLRFYDGQGRTDCEG